MENRITWFDKGTNHRCITLGTSPQVFLNQGRLLSNFCEVLGVGTHEGLGDMLRMSGVDEHHITGGGSDFDKLQALTEVLPLWMGHPYVVAIQQILADLFDCRLPLTQDTLPHIWQHTAHKLASENLTVAHMLTKYGYDQMICQAEGDLPIAAFHAGITPKPVLDVTSMVNPHVKAFVFSPCDMQLSPQQVWADMEAKLLSLLDGKTTQGVTDIWVDMSGCHTYQRPHPHKAGQAYLQGCQGKTVSTQEKDLLLSQMMRTLGQYAKAKGLHLVLYHVSSCVYKDMTNYLTGCGGDAVMTCVADDPAAVVDLARFGAKVMLSVDLCATREQAFQTFSRVASGMPFGCLEGLYLPVSGVVDLPLARRMYAWVNEWAAQRKVTLP